MLRQTAFNIAKNLKYDECQRGPTLMAYFHPLLCAQINLALKEEQKFILKLVTQTTSKVYSSFKDDMRGTDLANIYLINKYNRGI